MNFLSRIYHAKSVYNHKKEWFLIIIAFFFVLLRIPSLIEPHWYGDEGIYQVVGREIASGKILYKDIWDNKPPLLYIIYAVFYGNLFSVKLASLFAGLLSLFAFYALSGKIFAKNSSRYIATLLYGFLFATPLLEGNIANAENFMLLPVILAGYFVLNFSENKKNKYLIFSGVLLSIAFITKVVAIFDFIAFVVFLDFVFWDSLKEERKKTIVNFIFSKLLFLISFLSLFFIVCFYFFWNGAISDFVSGVLSQNLSYVNSQNMFIFPMGILLLKSILLLFVLFFLTVKRKKISKSDLFIYLWIAFSVYSAFFSQRPYIHYLLVMLPAFCLLLGRIIEINKRRIFHICLFLVLILVSYFYFTVYKKPFSYYVNYIEFITNHKSIVSYERFFDELTPRDYEIASFINTNVGKNESVFLWSDNAQIYALARKEPLGKYIVAYHITFYENAALETKIAIEKNKPRYIIQTTSAPFSKDIISSYKLKYEMIGTKIYERES
jgi:hypothetical protein